MSFVRRRNNMDELISIPTKAEVRSVVQILFMTQASHQERHNPESAPKFTADPRSRTVFSKSANRVNLPQKIHNSNSFKGPNRRSENLFTNLLTPLI